MTDDLYARLCIEINMISAKYGENEDVQGALQMVLNWLEEERIPTVGE